MGTYPYQEGMTYTTQTFRAMKTVLALMAKVSTAITTHITRSECRTSRCRARRNSLTAYCMASHALPRARPARIPYSYTLISSHPLPLTDASSLAVGLEVRPGLSLGSAPLAQGRAYSGLET